MDVMMEMRVKTQVQHLEKYIGCLFEFEDPLDICSFKKHKVFYRLKEINSRYALFSSENDENLLHVAWVKNFKLISDLEELFSHVCPHQSSPQIIGCVGDKYYCCVDVADSLQDLFPVPQIEQSILPEDLKQNYIEVPFSKLLILMNGKVYPVVRSSLSKSLCFYDASSRYFHELTKHLKHCSVFYDSNSVDPCTEYKALAPVHDLLMLSEDFVSLFVHKSVASLYGIEE